MSRLQTSYAGQFNRRHRMSGKLFQNRYKSIVCDEDVYFKELIAYVHLNPLRARLVGSIEKLGGYRWSGHRALLGKEKAPWQRVGDVLRQFGGKVGSARRNYLAYLKDHQGMKSGDLSGGGLIRSRGGMELAPRSPARAADEYDTRILGDVEFVRRVGRFVEGLQPPLELKGDVGALMKAVAERENVPLNEISTNGKTTGRGSRAQALIAHLATQFMRERKNRVADRLRVTPLAVTKLCRKGAEMVGEKGEVLLRELSMV